MSFSTILGDFTTLIRVLYVVARLSTKSFVHQSKNIASLTRRSVTTGDASVMTVDEKKSMTALTQARSM